MKKKYKLLIVAVLAFLFMIPSAFALSIEKAPTKYTQKVLEEALESEKIDYDFEHEYSNKHVKMYLFYGKGCYYCHNFLEFAASNLMDKYNDSLDIYAYEVWFETNNKELYDGVAKLIDEKPDGVPFIVIGETSFSGYSDDYDEKIFAAIDKEIENKNRVDMVETYITKYGYGQDYDHDDYDDLDDFDHHDDIHDFGQHQVDGELEDFKEMEVQE